MRRLLTTCLAGFACGGGAHAHHSPAAFDMTQDIVLEGTIAGVSWKNPHVYLTLETVGADGAPVMQRIELNPASGLRTAGMTESSFQIGERVSVSANPNRLGEGRPALGITLTKSDGTVLMLRNVQSQTLAGAAATGAAATSIAGVWSPGGGDFVRTASAIPGWPFTEEGRRAARDRAAQRAAAADCTTFGPPSVMLLPGLIQIELRDDAVLIEIDDGVGARRVVHLDGVERPTDAALTLEGYSVGRWEDGTLIVETSGFAVDPEGMGFNLPSSAEKHVVERLTLSEDGRSLRYEATVEDPIHLTGPVSFTSTWAWRPDLSLSGVACDASVALEFLGDE